MKPTRANIVKLVSELERLYGSPRFISRFEPMDELVSCILSQHTADANSFPTFQRLKAKYPEWSQVESLSTEQLAIEIRSAGLGNQKAKAIRGCLKEIRQRCGDYDLELLRTMPIAKAKDWLISLPGVGPKTAAIVLLFSFGREAIPVDTHVFRVSWRLGLSEKKKGEVGAQHALEAITPPDLMYRLHVALIQHGRHLCDARRPLCESCPLKSKCDYFVSTHSESHEIAKRGQPKLVRPSPRPSAQRGAVRKGRVSREQ